jgi:hypothetical protein
MTPDQVVKLLEFIKADGKLDFDKDPAKLHGILSPYSDIPTPSFANAKEVKNMARERSEKIFMHWNDLNGMLERHEELIQKRLLKRSCEQRTKIILQAWNRPDLATSHRPGFLAMRRRQEQPSLSY